ncbi:hypothetical protein TWF788_010826 [Orbilia oligospora]|uniref:Uncharacterized protein n=1 Tax=Orbilia oligospora TaxID=2813651 RepID=A0A7C8PK29_ORBOL|nr:hypothetical protein TWF788_010826 [Orbilia oligospora]
MTSTEQAHGHQIPSRIGGNAVKTACRFFPCSVLTNLEEFASYQEAQTEEALEAAASSESGERRRQLAKVFGGLRGDGEFRSSS